MNLNSITKMSEEELETIIQIAKGELASRFKRYEIGLKVKITAPACTSSNQNEFLKGKIGKIYGSFLDEAGTRLYEVTLDSQPGVNTYNGFWEFKSHEFEPVGETLVPMPQILTTTAALHEILGQPTYSIEEHLGIGY